MIFNMMNKLLDIHLYIFPFTGYSYVIVASEIVYARGLSAQVGTAARGWRR